MGKVAKVRRFVVTRAVDGRVCSTLDSAASDQLKGGDHVLVPVEEEADLGAASAGSGTHGQESGDGVDGVFDGLGDEDLHLFDGHDAIVDTN